LATATIEPQAVPGKMPIMSHLRELRDRIFKSLIALAIGVGIGFIFAPQLIVFLKHPAGNISFQAIKPMENLTVFFKASLVLGLIVAMPFLVYQIFAFVAPGLTSKERNYIYKIVPAVVLMFILGLSFAYFVALPPAMHFMANFMSNIASNDWQISEYIDIVTRMLVVIGLVFETPLVIMFMARMGLVSPQWLAGKRKWWFVLAFVISAIVTPTPDPVNQTVIAIPLILLFELSIFLARIAYRKRKAAAEASQT
jgi:sec-independent protein translocase protein TatC